jgi:hypothetical protein
MMSAWRPSFPKEPKLSHVCSLASKSRFVELGATCKFTPLNAIAPHISGLTAWLSKSRALLLVIHSAVGVSCSKLPRRSISLPFLVPIILVTRDMHPISLVTFLGHVSWSSVRLSVVCAFEENPLVCHSTAFFSSRFFEHLRRN